VRSKQRPQCRVVRSTFCQGAKSSPEKSQILGQGAKEMSNHFFPNSSAVRKSYEKTFGGTELEDGVK